MNFRKDLENLVKEIVGVPNKSLLHIVMTFWQLYFFSDGRFRGRQGSHNDENLTIDRSRAPLCFFSCMSLDRTAKLLRMSICTFYLQVLLVVF